MNTSLEAWIEEQPRVAGKERGRIHNTWVDCPYTIEKSTALRGGFAWSAQFVARDEPADSPHKQAHFNGWAETRAAAKGAAFNAITKRMSEVVEMRKDTLRARDQAARYLATTNAVQRLWHRVRAFFARFFNRHAA